MSPLLSSFSRHTILSTLFAWFSITLSGTAMAQQSDEFNWLQAAKDRVTQIADQGSADLYVSGLAHHGRSTYTKEKLNELNEHAWGLGYGKTLRNERGDDESLYAFILKDSHRHPQYMAGYAYEWIVPIPHTSLELGLGGTAMLMSRQDYFGSIPFPLALPMASIGTKNARVMFAYVPRLSANKNNGDVLLVFARFAI